MNTCPICGGRMHAGQWVDALPPIRMADGSHIRPTPATGAPGAVCPECSLLWMPPQTLSAPAELPGNGPACPACGRPTAQGAPEGRIPDFVTSAGGKIQAALGSSACAACPSCGLLHLLGRRLMLQTPEAAAREIMLKGKARAERIISKWMFGFLAFFGFLAVLTFNPFSPLNSLFRVLLYVTVGAMIGGTIGAIIVRVLRLPPPWRRRD